MSLVIACGPAGATPSSSPTPFPTLPPLATPSPTPSPSPTPARTPAPLPTATKAGAPVRYVAMGASDTVGVGSVDPSTGSWPSRIAAVLPPGSTYRNLGVSGSLAAQAARDQLPSAVAEDPDLVTIWLAVNDINAQVSDKDYATALNAIVDGLTKTTHARIFIGNVPDLR
ncbi:MAG: hypothetical protein KGK34_13335, partial [Chloroflexota bacterium]|nr:hypothetical protein [Chloroflexota bacterium]